ncbi:MAG: hypothetical protein A2Y12_20435 [Planctomycetes bacterium GWF2_42_9]|nr:MAG: hypothetical protein A2Y12_20435 [Planctomycetes bacterium GWF2_42_9]
MGQKTGVKSGLFHCFSRLFHRKIGKIPSFSGFFVIFREARLRKFRKRIVLRKIIKVSFFMRNFKPANLHLFSKKLRGV